MKKIITKCYRIMVWFSIIFKCIAWIIGFSTIGSVIYGVYYIIVVNNYEIAVFFIFIPIVLKYMKPLITGLYKLISMASIFLIGHFIYIYKRGRNIIEGGVPNWNDFYFLSIPFFGEKVYFDLDYNEKLLLNEPSTYKRNIIVKINQYFNGKSGMKDVTVKKYDIDENLKSFILYRPVRVDESDIYKLHSGDVLHAIGLSVDKYSLAFEVKNTIKLTIKKKIDHAIYDIDEYLEKIPKGSYCFGIIDGNDIYARKLDFNLKHHLGVYGTSGSGKSNFVTSLIYSSYLLNNWEYVIIDPKGDMSLFENLERITYAHKPEDIVKVLKSTKNKMDDRKTYFHLNNYRNYVSYEKKDRNKDFAPVFIFIEEFSYLIKELESENKEVVTNIIQSIANTGRSFAYSLIFSLQTPLKKVIGDSEITRQIDQVSFQIEDSMKQYIFGKTQNINLSELGLGEAYIKQGSDIKKFKSFYVSDESLSSLDRFRKKTKNKQEEYLEYAKSVNKFNKKDAMTFGLSRTEFDQLSSELQERKIIIKAPNNTLLFTESDNFEEK